MYKMAVLAKAVAGQKEELARWYDEQHIPDLLAVPGVTSAERLQISPLKVPSGTTAWDFMLVYEFAGDDPMVVIRAMGDRQGSNLMPWSDALERDTTVSVIGNSFGKREAGG